MSCVGLLPAGAASVNYALQQEEQRLLEHRHVLTEVHQVLEEMVYDVETCEYECEIARLKHELKNALSLNAEFQEREIVLIRERQQAFDYALSVEKEGRAIIEQLNSHMQVVFNELGKKDTLEHELAQAKEQLRMASQTSKELANAQREIRELHRKNSIQRLLKTNNIGSTNANGRGVKHDRGEVLKNKAPLLHQPSTDPDVISNQAEAIPRVDQLSRCSEKALMKVFAHLDANSVLAISLTSCTLMARVHTMFGMPPNAIMLKRSRVNQPVQPQPITSSQPIKPAVVKAKSQPSVLMPHHDKGRAQLAKAEQIVKSLKKDEIKLFHDMSTRVKTLENHLSHVQAEKEDIAARLHSAESVRDFLMDKLKELEDRMAVMMEATSKQDEKTSVDREIMGFLDARIQEYELTVQRLAKQNEDYAVELKRMREEHATKITIVQDMVNLLSEEKRSLDTQLKSQRKVLVREVKALRVQTQQLTDEKHRYFTQLKQLRHALQHLDELA